MNIWIQILHQIFILYRLYHANLIHISKYQISYTTLTGQFVHASQNLPGLLHRFQKVLPRLLRHVQRQALPGVLIFLNIFVFPFLGLHLSLILHLNPFSFCLWFPEADNQILTHTSSMIPDLNGKLQHSSTIFFKKFVLPAASLEQEPEQREVPLVALVAYSPKSGSKVVCTIRVSSRRWIDN